MSITALLLTNLLNGLMAILLLVLGYKIFDWLTPRWNFYEVFQKDRVSNGSIVIAAFLLGLSLIIMSAAF